MQSVNAHSSQGNTRPEIGVLPCIHQTPEGPPHHGDVYAPMIAWAEPIGPGHEQGDMRTCGKSWKWPQS